VGYVAGCRGCHKKKNRRCAVIALGTPQTPNLEGQQPVPPDLPERRLQAGWQQRLKG
jgi:hypothetical protein